jgi:hypothetical protein
MSMLDRFQTHLQDTFTRDIVGSRAAIAQSLCAASSSSSSSSDGPGLVPIALWGDLDTLEGPIYVPMLPLAMSDSSSLVYLGSLVRFVAACEISLNQAPDNLDALLGCPVALADTEVNAARCSCAKLRDYLTSAWLCFSGIIPNDGDIQV